MFKQLLLGIIAVSALALLWSEANAQDCVRWRRVGGSNVCVAYSTGSIIVQIQFRQDCGPDGSGCEADIFAESSNNIAFCVNLANPSGPPSRTTCNESVTFSSPAETCEPKHEQDGTTDGGVGHLKGHKCTSTTAVPPSGGSCQAACTAASLGPVVDVVPVEMDTNVTLFVSGGGGEDFVAAQAAGSPGECDPES